MDVYIIEFRNPEALKYKSFWLAIWKINNFAKEQGMMYHETRQ